MQDFCLNRKASASPMAQVQGTSIPFHFLGAAEVTNFLTCGTLVANKPHAFTASIREGCRQFLVWKLAFFVKCQMLEPNILTSECFERLNHEIG